MTPSVHLNTYVHLSKLFFRTKWNLQLINNWPNTIESKCPHKVMANLFKMYHRRHSEIANRYWPIRQPVLTNSPTGIGQFANRYWPIRQPVLTKSSTGIGQFANRYWPNRQPVLTKSPTGIGQFANRYWPIRQPVLIKSYTISCPDFLIFEIISQFKTKTLSLEQNS